MRAEDFVGAAAGVDLVEDVATAAFLSTPPCPRHAPFKVAPLNGVPSLQTAVTAAVAGEGDFCAGEVVRAGAAAVCATAEIEKLAARATNKNIFFMTNSPNAHEDTCML